MIGRVISHYRLLDKLGEGGMGVVYRAEDQTLGRQVAVKLLPSHLISDPQARRRFVREAKATAALDHPGICTVYEAGEAEGHLFIAMALLEGETLRKHLAAGPLSIDASLEIAMQVASALAAAHGKGIVHRDVKPENVMLQPGGQAKVLDFGLARMADASQLTRTGTVVGTVAYMSPEQLWGKVVDERTDIWSLGVVLYEMLSGEPPFRAAQESALKYLIANQAPEPLKALRPDVPPALEQVVTRCMEKKAPDRYASGADVLVELERVRRLPKAASAAVRRTGQPAARGSSTVSAVQILGERYRIERLLGRGGMGEVWLAFDLKLGVEVALKFLLPELGFDPERVALLRREVRSARNVASPHVCRVFDLVEIEGQEVVSMEYVDGTTLQELLATRSPLEIVEARRIATQLLSGLQDIHGAGLIHRDLKPSNVMITRSGRAVVMDFGLAKGEADSRAMSVAGTPAYMAPEQMRGEEIDARADLYAVGMILSEMVSPEGVRDPTLRRALWDGLRHDPPKAPAGPWEGVIRRAVAMNRGERFTSAAEMARELGGASGRISIIDEQSPYPGLSTFTGEQARFFFGREMDVESIWRKLSRLSLSALIGPSGVGKSSFLRAGVMASRPEGWSVVITTPGNAPFTALGRSLLPEFVGQTEAMQDLFSLQDIDRSIPLLNKWRQRSKQALLIVDQFEELFTLNPPEVQARFAELLGRLSVEADIHVLVSMRDDFFFLCHQYPALRPLFTEPTPLGPLSPQDLRRAIVEPARLCGFTFEDEALINEMMKEVEGERGALPLVAFATAKLWDLRDREHGVISRRSYEEIGRVGGALAQHAEATLERIGHEREEIVREIFRNLVTAQNTRVVRERDDLLSVFEDRTAAGDVLNALIDARLLTSFEITEVREGSTERHRIEIVHESLLTSWPRLVRWQTQDTEGAQLRDQLRQAAQLWKERSESDDLLWTGTAYKEFELWRERYPGGLTETEDAFASAMTLRVRRQRRRRRIALVSSFTLLVAVIGVIGWSLRGEKAARLSAEAGKLVALGREEMSTNPGAAIAYAVAGLERRDEPVNRLFALEALARGPVPFLMPHGMYDAYALNFSPDGTRLLVYGYGGGSVYSHDGSPQLFHTSTAVAGGFMFAPDGDRMVGKVWGKPRVFQVWSVSQARVVRTIEMEKPGFLLGVRGGNLIIVTNRDNPADVALHTWAFDDGDPKMVARFSMAGWTDRDVDPTGQWMAYTKDRGTYISSLVDLGEGRARLVGEHPFKTAAITFGVAGDRIASADTSGEIRIWSVAGETRAPLRVLHGPKPVRSPQFDPTGRWFAAVCGPQLKICLWDLHGPQGAEPVILRITGQPTFPLPIGLQIRFDPTGRWIAATYRGNVAFWPVGGSEHHVLPGIWRADFAPDGRLLVDVGSEFGSLLRVQDLTGGPSEEFWKSNYGATVRLTFDPRRRYVGVASEDGAYVKPLSDGQVRQMSGVPYKAMFAPAVSSDGTLLAFLGLAIYGDNEEAIVLWDLEADTARVLEGSRRRGGETGWSSLAFSENGRLFSGDAAGNITQWNLKDDSHTVIHSNPGSTILNLEFARDERFLFVNAQSGEADQTFVGILSLLDLETRNSRAIASHGNKIFSVAMDSARTMLVTASLDGTIRVGPPGGEEPYTLVLPTKSCKDMRVSRDGRWIAVVSGAEDDSKAVLHVFRTPEGPSLNTLPHDGLLGHLRALTNLRVVPDDASRTGYRIDKAPFPGWKDTPAR